MSADVSKYLALITSEYASKPNFLAVIAAITQGHADNQALLATLYQQFDVDTAVGVQLDTVGLWVGRSRFLQVPLVNVYFSLDTVGVGLDQGIWYEPFNPTTGLVRLADEQYRLLLKAVIAANQWDGTIPTAYSTWASLFSVGAFTVIIQDNGDMTMLVGLVGPTPNAVTQALLTSGEVNLKPDGVLVNYAIPSAGNTPFFGLDVENSNISGLDVGSWADVLSTQ